MNESRPGPSVNSTVGSPIGNRNPSLATSTRNAERRSRESTCRVDSMPLVESGPRCGNTGWAESAQESWIGWSIRFFPTNPEEFPTPLPPSAINMILGVSIPLAASTTARAVSAWSDPSGLR